MWREKPGNAIPLKTMQHNLFRSAMTWLFRLNDLFADKLLDDDRDPFLQFTVPWIGEQFAVMAPRMQFWMHLVYVCENTLGETHTRVPCYDMELVYIYISRNIFVFVASLDSDSHCMCL